MRDLLHEAVLVLLQTDQRGAHPVEPTPQFDQVVGPVDPDRFGEVAAAQTPDRCVERADRTPHEDREPDDQQQTESLQRGNENIMGIRRHAAPDIGNGDDAHDDIDPAVDPILQHA